MAGHCGTIKGAHKCQLYVFNLSGPIRREQSQSAAYQLNMHPNSCETLRSELEKWFSITNVLLRFRQKRRGGGGQDWQCHRWLSSYYHQLIGGAPATGEQTTKNRSNNRHCHHLFTVRRECFQIWFTIMFAFYAGGRKNQLTALR